MFVILTILFCAIGVQARHEYEYTSEDEVPSILQHPSEYVKFNTTLPDVMVVSVGSTLHLECNVFGTPTPTTKWLHNGRILADNVLDIDRDKGLIFNLNADLVIDCVLPRHEGEYFCSASTGQEKAITTNTVKVIVEAKGKNADDDDVCVNTIPKGPTIAKYYKQVSQHCQRDLVLPCVASGSDELRKMHWTRNGNILRAHKFTSSRYQILENGFLHIKNIRWSDMGMYECHVSDPFGTTKISTFVYPMGDEISCF